VTVEGVEMFIVLTAYQRGLKSVNSFVIRFIASKLEIAMNFHGFQRILCLLSRVFPGVRGGWLSINTFTKHVRPCLWGR
jgi:hypothetical protein